MINLTQQPLKEYAYNSIKKKILNCEYYPNMILSEDMLCTDLNISRTPVRDALSRLSQDNLVTIVPKRGIFVQGITLNEMKNIYDVRMIMEPQIILKYGMNGDLTMLKKFLEDLKKFDVDAVPPADFSQLDSDFHGFIFSMAQNLYFNQLYTNISNQNFRISVMSGWELGERRHESMREHIQIVEHLIAQELEAAASVMETHIKKARQCKMELLLSSNSFSNQLSLQ